MRYPTKPWPCWALAWGLFAALLSPSSIARARNWDETCLDTLNDDDVTLELAQVESSFAAQRLGASLWWSGWNGFNVFNTVVAWWKYAASDKRLARDSWLVSGIGASLFVIETSVLPLPGMYGYRRLSRLPEATPEQRRAKLRSGLDLLDKSAFVEKSNSNLLAHVFGFVYAAASTGYVWARNTHAEPDRLRLAVALQFVTSIAFAEFTFWTVPRRGRRDFKRIKNDVCQRAAQDAIPDPPVPARSLSLTTGLGQLALTARF